ncbi:Elongation factor Tu [compost metagenome]
MSDFIAQLHYRTTQEGGRETPAFSKYRPQIKFDFDEMQTSGEQTFIDKDTVYPGEEVKAVIRIAGVLYFKGRLAEGMLFEFREGPRVIGTGKILQILNDTLKIDDGSTIDKDNQK